MNIKLLVRILSQSNGIVPPTIQTVKRTLRKAKSAKEDHYQDLLPTKKLGHTVRVRIDEETIWDNKGFAFATNGHLRLYKVLNEKGNLVVRSRRH